MMPHPLRSSIVVLGAVLIGWLPLHAGNNQAGHDSRVVASVGTLRIRVGDLQRERATARRQDLAANRLDGFTSGATKKILDEIIAAKLLAAGARAQKLDERADVREQIEHTIDLILAQAMSTEIISKADLTETRLREFYSSHLDAFQAPSRVRARHIVVKTQPEAVALVGRLKRNADFAALAREHNTDASRQKGGELGWVARGVMVKSFEDALFALPVGGLSPIVQTSFGFHIIKVEEIEAARPKPYEAVASDVRQMLLAEEIAAARTALAAKYPVTVHDAVLKSIR